MQSAGKSMAVAGIDREPRGGPARHAGTALAHPWMAPRPRPPPAPAAPAAGIHAALAGLLAGIGIGLLIWWLVARRSR